ncbi:hypothetical protein PVAP13_7KG101800 [Panicum virgatum]|uniref:Uncharacterized protein n=1 Tax=Panicum virgatum TaxID=38727 RepID=A0A8T0QF97_PANVG|nr:hypothetical protein PVAP13_7KG101800 [Panicum virgatum]
MQVTFDMFFVSSCYSGIAMLVMSRHFNGNSLDVEITKEYLDRTQLKFMFEVLSLKDSEADLPLMLSRIIKS